MQKTAPVPSPPFLDGAHRQNSYRSPMIASTSPLQSPAFSWLDFLGGRTPGTMGHEFSCDGWCFRPFHPDSSRGAPLAGRPEPIPEEGRKRKPEVIAVLPVEEKVGRFAVPSITALLPPPNDRQSARRLSLLSRRVSALVMLLQRARQTCLQSPDGRRIVAGKKKMPATVVSDKAFRATYQGWLTLTVSTPCHLRPGRQFSF